MTSRLLCVVLAVLCCGAPSLGQWTAIHLHTSGDLRESSALAGNAAIQGGFIVRQGSVVQEPAIWTGTSSSWLSFATAPQTEGRINAVWGSMQGGEWAGRASLWSGTAASIIDLHPNTGFVSSSVVAMRGNQQVGHLSQGTNLSRAALWTGSAASLVNLHPSGMAQSWAQASDGLMQGGAVRDAAGITYAALWSGSAASMVNLNPGPQYSSSITCMVPGQQGGRISLGLQTHAAIWSGTPESVVDLHPFPGFGQSFVYGTTGVAQVGSSSVPGHSVAHAALWFGTAESFVDLHAFLPPGYSSSGASDVWLEGQTLYIVGGAGNSAGRSEAWMWVGTIPAPGTAAVLAIGGLVASRRRRSAGQRAPRGLAARAGQRHLRRWPDAGGDGQAQRRHAGMDRRHPRAGDGRCDADRRRAGGPAAAGTGA
jgi:hypothetical protein